MLQAARAGDWDEVVKLEGACVLLMLKDAAREEQLVPNAAKLKARLMQRILVNDAEIRHLAEPWLEDLDRLLHRSLAAPTGSASGFTPGSTASCRREARHRPGAVTRGNPGALRRPVLGGGRYVAAPSLGRCTTIARPHHGSDDGHRVRFLSKHRAAVCSGGHG